MLTAVNIKRNPYMPALASCVALAIRLRERSVDPAHRRCSRNGGDWSGSREPCHVPALARLAIRLEGRFMDYRAKCKRLRTDGPTPCLCCPDLCVGDRPGHSIAVIVARAEREQIKAAFIGGGIGVMLSPILLWLVTWPFR